MTLRQLRDLIRFEAKIKGPDTLTGFLNALINEVLREYTARVRCPELKLINQNINAVASNNPNFPIPATLQFLLMDRVRYDDDGQLDTCGYLYSGDFNGSAEGMPRKYQRVGANFIIWPQTISSSAKLFIDYYSFPSELVEDTDVFPVPNLEQVVKQECIARTLRHSETGTSRSFQQSAQQSFAAVNPQIR